MITVAPPPADDPRKPQKSTLTVAPPPQASTLHVAPPPKPQSTLQVAPPPSVRSAQQEYQEGQRNLHDTFQPGESPMQTIGNMVTGGARTFMPEVAQGVDMLMGTSTAKHATNALNKVGTVASVPGDLLGAISRDLDAPPAGNNPLERLKNSNVARSLGMMINDVAHLHNMQDVQSEYYLTGTHNLHVLAAQGDKTAQALIAHPWINAALTFGGELLNPVNYTPAGIAKLLSKAKWLQHGYEAAKQAGRAAAAAHPTVAKAADAVQEVFGSGARHLDAGVHPQDVAKAHAARRELQAAQQRGVALARRRGEVMFGGAQPEDIEPALMAAQRRSKEAWLHQQQLTRPDLVQRAQQFRSELAQAHAAGVGPKPSVPSMNWQRVLGKPSVFDLGEGNWFTKQSLADLPPEDQAHVLKLASEMELAEEGPAMHELSPQQARIANAFRGVMGHTTAITRNQRPEILHEGGEQIGFVPSRNIWFRDAQLGSRGALGIGEPIDQARLLTLFRRRAIVAHDAKLPPGDPGRILGDAVPEGADTPYQALTPQQATENFLARRYANLFQGQAQQQFSKIRSATGERLVHEPQLPSVTTNGATVIPQDRAALKALIEGDAELRAVKALAAREGISEAEAQAYLHDRPTMRGVATGRAREAQQAANKAEYAAQKAGQQLERGGQTLSDLGPEQVREQLRTEDALARSAQKGDADQAALQTRNASRIAKMKQQGVEHAKRLIDRFLPSLKSARALGAQIAERPGSTEARNATRAELRNTQAALAEIREQIAKGGDKAAAQQQLARAIVEDGFEAQGNPVKHTIFSLLRKRFDNPPYLESGDVDEYGQFHTKKGNATPSKKGGGYAGAGYTRQDILDSIKFLKRYGVKLGKNEAEAEQRLRALVEEAYDHFNGETQAEIDRMYGDFEEPGDEEAGAAEEPQRDLRAEQAQALAARKAARGAHQKNVDAFNAMGAGDRATTKGARALIGKNESFAQQLAKNLAARHKTMATGMDVVRGDVEKAGTISRQVGQRAIDIADEGHLRQSKALKRGLAGAQQRMAQTQHILDRAAAKASDRAAVANIQRQYANATMAEKLRLQSVFKRILKDTPRMHVPPLYDESVWKPIKDIQIGPKGATMPLNWLDGDGKLMHRSLVEQLQYDHAPPHAANAVADFLTNLNFGVRAGMFTNPAIHPIGNQGMLYAMVTGDWAGLADHAATLLTGLDPAESVNLLTKGPKAFNAVPNAIVHGARALARFGWQRVGAQVSDLANEIEIAKRYHVYDDVPPMGYDMPDVDMRPQYDTKTGKLAGFETPVRREEQPAYLENVPIDRLPPHLQAKRIYREFAKWNHKIVWETSEPLLAARWIRHFMSKGMDEAQAADAARDWLGSDKMTNFWRFHTGLLFPRWTRTVLWASMHLGLMRPDTWNAPLQATRVQREGVGAGDVPTGAGPFAVAFPNGTDPNTGQPQFTFFEPHNPLGTTENMLAGAAFGDPRYGGFAGHGFPVWSYYANRLVPAARIPAGLAASAGTSATGRYLPGTYISPHDRGTPEALRDLFEGLPGSLFMPLELGTEALENPFTIPASLTGSTVYQKHDGFQYPDGP